MSWLGRARAAMRQAARAPIHATLRLCKPYRAGRTEHELAICATFREEAPFLDEWISFHIGIGVTHFFLYNNFSTTISEDQDRPRRRLDASSARQRLAFEFRKDVECGAGRDDPADRSRHRQRAGRGLRKAARHAVTPERTPATAACLGPVPLNSPAASARRRRLGREPTGASWRRARSRSQRSGRPPRGNDASRNSP